MESNVVVYTPENGICIYHGNYNFTCIESDEWIPFTDVTIRPNDLVKVELHGFLNYVASAKILNNNLRYNLFEIYADAFGWHFRLKDNTFNSPEYIDIYIKKLQYISKIFDLLCTYFPVNKKVWLKIQRL